MPLISEDDYTNAPEKSSNNKDSGMWIQAVMGLFDFGQKNTIRNAQIEQQRQQDLAGVLFRDRSSNSDVWVMLGIFAIIGIVLYVIVKGK